MDYRQESMVNIAFEILTKSAGAMSFYDIWKEVAEKKEFDEELVHELIKKIYVGIDNSVEIEFKCSDPYQEVLAFVAEVQNE
mgnify:CR=1 FL=1